MKKSLFDTHLILLPFIVLLFFGSISFSKIVKDSDGNEYVADKLLVKLKSVSANQHGKAIGRKRLLTIYEAGPLMRSLKAKWAVKKSKALFPQVAVPNAQGNMSYKALQARQKRF